VTRVTAGANRGPRDKQDTASSLRSSNNIKQNTIVAITVPVRCSLFCSLFTVRCRRVTVTTETHKPIAGRTTALLAQHSGPGELRALRRCTGYNTGHSPAVDPSPAQRSVHLPRRAGTGDEQGRPPGLSFAIQPFGACHDSHCCPRSHTPLLPHVIHKCPIFKPQRPFNWLSQLYGLYSPGGSSLFHDFCLLPTTSEQSSAR
jgi:hypothetical protein